MRILLAICMMVIATLASAADQTATNQPAVGVVQGEVLEVQDVPSYTYLRLKTQNGETWAAIVTTPIKPGAKVTIENAIVMTNFQSKTLNKTFPTIIFGSLAGAAGSAPSQLGMYNLGAGATGGSAAMGGAPMGGAPMGGANTMGNALGTAFTALPGKKLEQINDVHVSKAKGANAKTVAEIVKNRIALKGKTVVVRGKVVKYNAGILGKNWVHLRDGSGSAADQSDDILVTTQNETKLDAIVTVKGVVHNDEDFGAGYAYKVLIEEATLK
jgi:hypothetical protein